MEILKDLGIYSVSIAGIGTFIAFVGRSFIRSFLDKDFEKYKTKLQHEQQLRQMEFDKDLESFKTELVNNSYKHNRLHDITLQVIENLYEKIATLELSLREMAAPLKRYLGNEEKMQEAEFLELKEASDIYNDLLVFYGKKRIYIPKEICEKLDLLTSEVLQCLSEFDNKNRYGQNDPSLKAKLYSNAVERARESIPEIKKSLEVDFREMVGGKIILAK